MYVYISNNNNERNSGQVFEREKDMGETGGRIGRNDIITLFVNTEYGSIHLSAGRGK